MKAARLHSYEDGELRLEEVEEPKATAAHDVVVRIGGDVQRSGDRHDLV
jgi:hypothetical protein